MLRAPTRLSGEVTSFEVIARYVQTLGGVLTMVSEDVDGQPLRNRLTPPQRDTFITTLRAYEQALSKGRSRGNCRRRAVLAYYLHQGCPPHEREI